MSADFTLRAEGQISHSSRAASVSGSGVRAGPPLALLFYFARSALSRARMTPPEKLRRLLAVAREQGSPFDAAFAAALPEALSCGLADWDRETRMRAIEGTVSAWRNAYELHPPSNVEAAFVNVAEPLAA